jgi:nucleotidyltransferase substrate binding protein (TIGR01987 family)
VSEIDLAPLRNAIARLGEALREYEAEPAHTVIRDGLIQRFEFSYDLSAKMLRRVMQLRAAEPDHVAAMSFPELIRNADEQMMVSGGWPQWKRYREMRNITSHTYDAEKAREVASAIPKFFEEAREMERRLSAYLAQAGS